MNPRVKSAAPMPGWRLEVEFTNGERGVFDCAPFLGFGVFQELADPAYFNRVFVSMGTVVWPNGQDICPDTLYEDARKMAEAV
jgi:hypothetical protein